MKSIVITVNLILLISASLSIKLKSDKAIPFNIQSILGQTEVKTINPGQYSLAPEIVNKRIVLESKEPVAAVKQIPSQLGYMQSKNIITGLTENQKLDSFNAIMGNVNSIQKYTEQITTPTPTPIKKEQDQKGHEYVQLVLKKVPNEVITKYQ